MCWASRASFLLRSLPRAAGEEQSRISRRPPCKGRGQTYPRGEDERAYWPSKIPSRGRKIRSRPGSCSHSRRSRILEQLTLLARKALRRLDLDLDVEVTCCLEPEHRHALRLDTELLAAFGAFRDLHLRLAAVNGRHLDLPAERAVVMAIGTRQKRSAPSRWKNSCGLMERKM